MDCATLLLMKVSIKRTERPHSYSREASKFHMELEEHLKKWFGYNTFRSYQKEIIEGILEKKDVLAILPTGAGKSLCYQLPAMLLPGTAIVISPLISLMQDQVSFLIKSGIPAAYINSSLSSQQFQEIFRNLSSYKLLYIAPERFADQNFLDRLKALPLSFFVIDEAHCISQWGHSFRPDYRQLSLIKKNFPDKPMMAVTATATAEVEKDIATQLAMAAPFLAKGSFDRPNLMIRINKKSNPHRQIEAFLENHKGESGIIYASTRKSVDTLYNTLQNAGFSLGRYHAGLDDEQRKTALHDFIHDKTNLMVATVAFGMGINKPDIRFVLHNDMPRTIEQYYQEIGRAGRDGLPAECLMLYSGQDLMIYNSFLKDIPDAVLRAKTAAKTQATYAFCQSTRCRRTDLLRYFGETYHASGCKGCESCDNCADHEENSDGIIIAQKILSCVYRLNQAFSASHVIEVLRGAKSAELLRLGHNSLSTYNIMSEYSEEQLRSYITTMLRMGLLKSSEGPNPVLQWTDASRVIIKGEQKVEFHNSAAKEKVKDPTSLPYNAKLFTVLRQLRMELARERNVPPFAVFPDRALFEMATYFPHTEADFLAINGVGRFKLQGYGTYFLQAIKEFCAKHQLTPQQKAPERAESASSKSISNSANESFLLFLQGKSLESIAKNRGLAHSTVTSHICQMIEFDPKGVHANIDAVVSKQRQMLINDIIDAVGAEKLSPIKELLPTQISYDEIRFVVALKKAKEKA